MLLQRLVAGCASHDVQQHPRMIVLTDAAAAADSDFSPEITERKRRSNNKTRSINEISFLPLSPMRTSEPH